MKIVYNNSVTTMIATILQHNIVPNPINFF